MSQPPTDFRALLQAAMSLSGFQNWRPAVDVPQLNRPIERPGDLPGSGRIAAVMVLFYSDPGSDIPSTLASLKLVLTKRHANLSKHARQISLPGGQQDPGESLEQTALRETHEEIGIAPQAVEVLGTLNPVYIPPSDFTVTPFVGWHTGPPKFQCAQWEVDELIETSLGHLLDPDTRVYGDIRSASGMNLNVPYYQVGRHRVWGATAIMLAEMIERVSRVVECDQGYGHN